jgi:hemolysin activation/secretion protein
MRRMRGLAWATVAASAAAGAAGGVAAQVPGQAVQASPLAPPTREELQRSQQAPQPRGAPQLQVEGGVTAAPCALTEPRFAGIRVTLTDAQFSGLRGVDPALLRPAYADYVGRDMPIAVVCAIRDAADAILAREGFISAVRVPPQKIDGGIVQFDVVMARVVALRVRGDAGRNEQRIAAYLRRLQDAPAFNARDAERALLLASDLPGYQVRLALSPAEGGQPGDVVGEISVVRQKYGVDFNLQNLGSQGVGRFGGLLRAQFYGLTGMGDRTSVSLFSTSDLEEQQVVQVGHDLRLGGSGVGLSGRFTYAWTRPAGTGLDIGARTLIAEAETTFPLVLKQTKRLTAAGGFSFVEQDVKIGPLLFTRDHLRVAYLRLDGESTDRASLSGLGGYTPYAPRLRMAGSLELRQGLDVLDATKPCGPALVRCAMPGAIVPSRAYGDPTAFLVRFAGTVEFRPEPNLTFAFTPRAQYAPNPLLSYEEYSGGSYTIGRGFDPGTVLGDSGFGFALEARVGSTVPRSAKAMAFEPYVFFDTARAFNRDRDLRPFNPQRLYSAGGGVRAAFGDRARLDATLAVPIDRYGPAGERVGSVRFLVSLTTRLLPWRRP